MSSLLQNNITNLQTILEQLDSLPEAGGEIELPVLTNEGVASDLASGKQLIDGNGNVVTGTHVCQDTGVTVQRKTGTFTTNSSGDATINCGFQPDIVCFRPYSGGSSMDTITGVGTFEGQMNFFLSERDSSKTGTWNVMIYASNNTPGWLFGWCYPSSNGFKMHMTTMDTSMSAAYFANQSINYIAVKIT